MVGQVLLGTALPMLFRPNGPLEGIRKKTCPRDFANHELDITQLGLAPFFGDLSRVSSKRLSFKLPS